MPIIDRPEIVTSVCRKNLQSILGHSQLGFSRDSGSAGTVYNLTSVMQAMGYAVSRYPVVPLFDANEKSFWVAVSLTFAPHLGRFRVANISILFFEGERYDPLKTPLLRAEWDEWTDSNHAQPHWHVYSSPLKKVTSTPATFDEHEDASEFGATETFVGAELRLDLARVHCAMAATWHLEPPALDQIPFTFEELCRWLPRCILYTRRQLEYICR